MTTDTIHYHALRIAEVRASAALDMLDLEHTRLYQSGASTLRILECQGQIDVAHALLMRACTATRVYLRCNRCPTGKLSVDCLQPGYWRAYCPACGEPGTHIGYGETADDSIEAFKNRRVDS